MESPLLHPVILISISQFYRKLQMGIEWFHKGNSFKVLLCFLNLL